MRRDRCNWLMIMLNVSLFADLLVMHLFFVLKTLLQIGYWPTNCTVDVSVAGRVAHDRQQTHQQGTQT